MNFTKLIAALESLGAHVNLEAVVPALTTFVEDLTAALKDGKLSVTEGFRLAGELWAVVESARKAS